MKINKTANTQEVVLGISGVCKRSFSALWMDIRLDMDSTIVRDFSNTLTNLDQMVKRGCKMC